MNFAILVGKLFLTVFYGLNMSGRLPGCKECPYSAFGQKNLNNHMQTHQESQCTFCLKTLPTSSLAKYKNFFEKNPEQILIKCDQCPYETLRKDKLKRHIHCAEISLY